ncbi:MAG: BolA family transcriptional regulator [Turneriella sp.]|nr:BolA family transcriptional regulator [Leptospiraceae bacterium]MCX7633522.1 BolA family transcriptional regulator [Turneriella sp.]
MVDPQEVERRIVASIPGAKVIVRDPLRDGEHLEAVVASEKFVGMPLVQQHKLVMAALRDLLQERLHALQLKTMTPEQFQKEFL